jgi:hypothetical protein
MNTTLTEAEIAAAIDEEPALNIEGYQRSAVQSHKRDALRAAWPLIRDCALLLSAADPSPGALNSYTLKHRLEHRFEILGRPRYVANGVAILAAKLAGLRVRHIDGPNAVFDVHPNFLGGRTAGLAYRVRHSEAELAEVAALVDRVTRCVRNRRGVSPTRIVGPTEAIEPISAALHRSELVASADGRVLTSPIINGLGRMWSVRGVTDSRPALLAASIALGDLEAELNGTIAEAREALAQLSPEEAARPMPEAFAAAARDVELSFADLTAAFRDYAA